MATQQYSVEAEIAARMDRLPLSGAHIKALILAGFGPFFESFDQWNITYVLPAVLASFALSPTQAGFIAGAGTYGMALGCLLAGPLADRYGRKTVFQFFLLWFSLWSGLCALSWNLGSLAVIRFVLGVGLGGELPVGVSLISELLPKSSRRLLPFYQSFFAFGQIAAAGAALGLAPAFPIGWRLVFLVGLLPAFYAALLRRKLPESPRWLARNGRDEEARSALSLFEQSAGPGERTTREEATPAAMVRATEKKHGPLDLFRGRYARRTLINALYWLIFWLATGSTSLLYVVLVRRGFSLQTTLTFGLLATLASAPGYWISAYLLEKIGRKPTLCAYAILAGSAYYTIVHSVNPAVLVPTLLTINFASIGGVGALYTYLSEQYPTEIRATATAWVNAFGRLAMASGAVVSGAMIQFFGPQSAFSISGGAFWVAAALLLIFGIETKGKSLEEIQAIS